MQPPQIVVSISDGVDVTIFESKSDGERQKILDSLLSDARDGRRRPVSFSVVHGASEVTAQAILRLREQGSTDISAWVYAFPHLTPEMTNAVSL